MQIGSAASFGFRNLNSETSFVLYDIFYVHWVKVLQEVSDVWIIERVMAKYKMRKLLLHRKDIFKLDFSFHFAFSLYALQRTIDFAQLQCHQNSLCE